MQAVRILPAWSTRLIAELDAADERIRALCTGFSEEQLNWYPRPGAWSVGQCVEHLCITNELYLSSMSASLTGKPAGMVKEIELGWFARWFITSFVEPSSNTKKARAPKKIVPGSRVNLSILDRFLRSNENAREMIRSASGYNVNRIWFKNPFLPLVRFTVGTGLEAMCRHERRHLLQAERVAKSPGFLSATGTT